MRFLKLPLLFIGLVSVVSSQADTVNIDRFYLSSSTAMPCVILGDTAGVKKGFDPKDFIPSTPISQQKLVKSEQIAKTIGKAPSYVTITSQFENRSYTDASIKIKGIEDYKALLDGKELSGSKVTLIPGPHTIVISYSSENSDDTKPSFTIETDKDGVITPVYDGKRMVRLEDFLYGKYISGAEISPSGNFIIARYYDTDEKGDRNFTRTLYEAKSGKQKLSLQESVRWMPKSEKMWVKRRDYHHGIHIVTINPMTFEETILASNLPEGSFTIAPTEDFLIYRMERKGPKEDQDVYRVIEPEDRQPGWRDRSYPAIYRFADRQLMPLVHSKHNIDVLDITDDGTKLLLMSSSRRMTKRPTTLISIIELNLSTMKADTLIANDGFVTGAYYTPDAKELVVSGSPEAFDRVGCTLAADVTPSNYDNQLFLFNISDRKVKPLTMQLDPSVDDSSWSLNDGNIYIKATDKDKATLYRLDPKTAESTLMRLPENVIFGFSVPRSSSLLAWWGQGENNSDGLYILDTSTGQSTLIDRPSQDRLANLKLAKSTEWTFTTSRGYTICGMYYLPDNFDPSKKYPMIVNYYGGCSPSTRAFESRYPLHLYASLGYVVLQLQPSGATGFGQEWSSRHVSTAGKGVADDIIEATKGFCKEMDYVNPDKIGCIGASYGGFMTQYLQTQTDIFAAAISHAGISDHTSYWGEGYWGYSYSETSMGNDLPWTNPDLYVKQSPLFNVDKINTPILFLHGDADTNVPVGESIQMFTAMQRLGKESAMVLVRDQNHHITEFDKRRKWQDTIFAWFAKYLQDDESWWKSMYPDHNL